MNNTLDQTVKEVTIGIWIVGIVELLVCILFVGGAPWSWTHLKTTCIIGVLTGCMVGNFMFVHMRFSVEQAVMMGKGAPARSRMSFLFRYLISGAVMILLCLSGWADPIALLAGVFALKLGIYLNTPIHKFLLHGQPEPEDTHEYVSIPWDDEEEEEENGEDERSQKNQ